MVIDLEQNKKEENKTLRFFWIVLIPGTQSMVSELMQRGVAVTQGQLGRGLLQGAALLQDKGSPSEEQSSLEMYR